MKARARVVALARADGSTYLHELVSMPPLVLRPTPEALYVAAGAGGPLGGDELELHVTVGPGARLVVRSVGATLVLPGRRRDAPARLVTTLEVADGARLAWQPEPVVVTGRGLVESVVRGEVAASAELRWREVVVLGRHGEGPGRATLRTHVRVDGRPVLRSETRLGAGAAEFASPAGMAAKRVHGAALAVLPAYAAEPATAAAPDAWSARFPLAGPAAAGVALGDTAAEVAARLDALAVA